MHNSTRIFLPTNPEVIKNWDTLEKQLGSYYTQAWTRFFLKLTFLGKILHTLHTDHQFTKKLDASDKSWGFFMHNLVEVFTS